MLLPTERFPNTCWGKAGWGDGQGTVSCREIRQGLSAGTAKWRLSTRARRAAAEAAPGRSPGRPCQGTAAVADRPEKEQPPPAPLSRGARRRSAGAPAWEPLRGSALSLGGRYARAGAAQVRRAGRAQPLRGPAAARARPLSQPRCLVAGGRAAGSPARPPPAGRPHKLWVSVARVRGQRLSAPGGGWRRGSGAEPCGALRGSCRTAARAQSGHGAAESAGDARGMQAPDNRYRSCAGGGRGCVRECVCVCVYVCV